jgi:hypothetical protein
MGPIFLITFSVSSGVAGTEVMKQNPKSCYIDFQASETASTRSASDRLTRRSASSRRQRKTHRIREAISTPTHDLFQQLLHPPLPPLFLLILILLPRRTFFIPHQTRISHRRRRLGDRRIPQYPLRILDRSQSCQLHVGMSMTMRSRVRVGFVVCSRIVAPFKGSEPFQRGEDGVVRSLVEDRPGEERCMRFRVGGGPGYGQASWGRFDRGGLDIFRHLSSGEG